MQVKELIKELKKFNQEAELLVSSDEELNTLFTRWEVALLEEESNKKDQVVIYGFSGSEQDSIFEEEDMKSVEELIAEELKMTGEITSESKDNQE